MNIKPKYPNQCDHMESSFIGTVKLNGVDGDLYFYQSPFGHNDSMEWVYCFRHGIDGEYASGPMESKCNPTNYSDSFSRDEIINMANSDRQLIGYFIKHILNQS